MSSLIFAVSLVSGYQLSASGPLVMQTRASHQLMAGYRLNNYELPGPLCALNNQALIKLSKADDRTAGGLFVASEESSKPREGVVVAAGPGRTHPETGKLMANCVQEGDYVLLADFTGEKVEYCGESHMFINADEILGVFDGGVPKAEAFKPMRDRALVEVAEIATETASGIALAVGDEEQPTLGQVVKIGDGRLTSMGDLQPLPISIGDHVLYGKFSGTDTTLEGKKYKIVFASDCLGKW
uniref:20 kDa chaperonin, chloroplastic n=1 Tax=Calcidiscus leptoporus TaxID=127549 RepID=A0A7S0J0F3_9EUKA